MGFFDAVQDQPLCWRGEQVMQAPDSLFQTPMTNTPVLPAAEKGRVT